MARAPLGRRVPALVTLGILGFLAGTARAQVTNYLTANNGSETFFPIAGQASAAGTPNLYWRC